MSNYKLFAQNGFAYIWTLMLIAFMGVGLTIASELYATSVQRDKEKELLFIGHQFRSAIRGYYEGTFGGAKNQYPATFDDLLKDPRAPNTVRHLRQLYIDPMTGKADWEPILIQGKIVGIRSASNKKTIKRGNFQADDAAFQDKENVSEWEFTYPANLVLPKKKEENGSDEFPLK